MGEMGREGGASAVSAAADVLRLRGRADSAERGQREAEAQVAALHTDVAHYAELMTIAMRQRDDAVRDARALADALRGLRAADDEAAREVAAAAAHAALLAHEASSRELAPHGPAERRDRGAEPPRHSR
jgi:hypothetical protein